MRLDLPTSGYVPGKADCTALRAAFAQALQDNAFDPARILAVMHLGKPFVLAAVPDDFSAPEIALLTAVLASYVHVADAAPPGSVEARLAALEEQIADHETRIAALEP